MGQTEILKDALTKAVGMKGQKKTTLYKLDQTTGDIIECPNLPADPIQQLQRYLEKGLMLSREELKEESARIKQALAESKEFKCEICSKTFTSPQGLSGHMKAHSTG